MLAAPSPCDRSSLERLLALLRGRRIVSLTRIPRDGTKDHVIRDGLGRQMRLSPAIPGTGYATSKYRRDEIESACGLSFEVA